MKNEIALKKLNKIVLNQTANTKDFGPSIDVAMTLQNNVMSLGFMLDQVLLTELSHRSTAEISDIANEMVPVLQRMVGADVTYNPMYPNFPRQVMGASDLELWINAMVHYWSFGTWKPEYQKLGRGYAFETTKYTEIGLASKDDFNAIFTSLVGSNESLSETDRDIVEWFLMNHGKLIFPNEIPYKENMCIIGAYMVENKIDIVDMVKNATDVLRIATHMSDGDISLASNTRYKSFKRSERRMLVKALEKVISAEDINRHAGKWVRLAHSLHVGDFSNKVYEVLKKVRENEKIETFNSKVENFLKKGQPVKATKLLLSRPGDFARRLDHIIRLAETTENQLKVAKAFSSVAENVSTKVLLQLMGHFQNRHTDMEKRVVFPKGKIQNAQIIDGLEPLDKKVVKEIYLGCRKALVNRFAALETLGKVYIEPELLGCPIPTQQRSANTAMETVARGTRIPITEDKNTLRFFIYWIGRDIDLSLTMYDNNFDSAGHVSYTNLRNSASGVYHSGDIVQAPNGASEFIDVDMDKARSRNVRYVAMNVYVFSGPTFAEHKKCYAGWMTRSNPNSNEIYEPTTVENKIDLTGETRTSVPIIFDLWNREAIWVDLTTLPRNPSFGSWYRGNNVENNRAGIKDIVEAIATTNNKVSLAELFEMHREARGQVVENREDADIVFAWDGDITPKDINTIHSEYVL